MAAVTGIPFSAQFTPDEMDRDELVVHYSSLNYSCADIQNLLKYVHGHEIRFVNKLAWSGIV